MDGAPFVLEEDYLALEHGRHNFSDAQDQALCLDSLAGFAKAGFLAGPLPLGTVDAPKLVGAFTREQESSMKKRCISDLSQPRTGGSFNDSLGKGPVYDWPMLDPGTIQAAVLLIWKHGPGAAITKADISNAYKVTVIRNFPQGLTPLTADDCRAETPKALPGLPIREHSLYGSLHVGRHPST
jgi:hypothetical protein